MKTKPSKLQNTKTSQIQNTKTIKTKTKQSTNPPHDLPPDPIDHHFHDHQPPPPWRDEAKREIHQERALLRLHLGVHKEMEWKDHKGMERNGMEWNVFK